ncbi:hypothetical protein [Staphylococcus phage phiBU01]|uniref:Uncharacterized protein n=1 Tax=Staphylococcus phage phiBU01 TaxID=1519999 RepID=A0A075LZX2_9CAUD|nr:hypothetical protein SF20_gp16 [Staphylococcus phage phiBU01]AIF71741.1 hypothetical protein [Staphylococcus phage phiBU01]
MNAIRYLISYDSRIIFIIVLNKNIYLDNITICTLISVSISCRYWVVDIVNNNKRYISIFYIRVFIELNIIDIYVLSNNSVLTNHFMNFVQNINHNFFNSLFNVSKYLF